MERRQTKPYRVISLYSGRVFDFSSALAVANHLFVCGNFDLPHYPVYKYGRRFPRKEGGEIREYAKALDAWKPTDGE